MAINRIVMLRALSGASAITLSMTASAALAQSATDAPPQGMSGGAASHASAPSSTAITGAGEIIVTAQKRQQNLNDVPLSITAVSGDAMIQRGLTDAADLVKAVPGFTFSQTGFGTTIYTLRGVGFVDTALAASPAVSIYFDEVPLPFNIEARAPALDLERLEVLKGPQGTLYGQNSTGGAFNYISAKPTSTFKAGANVSYGSFNTLNAEGFISGPLTETLSARLALQTIQSDDWQKSYTRKDTLGAQHQTQGRLTFAWKPTDRLRFTLSGNGWIDHSEAQAPQLIEIIPAKPALITPGLLNYPPAPNNPRYADWTPGTNPRRDDYFFQIALRSEYDLTDYARVTSITSYSRLKVGGNAEGDGTAYKDFDRYLNGRIHSFSEELRFSGDIGRITYVAGANFSDDHVTDEPYYNLGDASNSTVLGLHYSAAKIFDKQHIRNYAGFANLEYKLTDKLTAQGGIRYTATDRSAINCGMDLGQGDLTTIFNALSTGYRGGVPPTRPAVPGGCYTIQADLMPGLYSNSIDEHNVSWRGSVNYKLDRDKLVYASVSKGYKAGSIPATTASSYVQYFPAKQESLLAYEAGFKFGLFDRKLQFNGAGFYYDYRNKQLLGSSLDTTFGVLRRLINIPKSRVIGAELEMVAKPVQGLTLNVSGTYLDTKILRYQGLNVDAQPTNFRGYEFPYSPHFQVVTDASYEWAVNDHLKAFVGGNLAYRTRAFANFSSNSYFRIPGYALLDLRAGIATPGDVWRFSVFGRNVTNKNYANYIERQQDYVVRYVGRPATFGVQINYRFH